MEKNKSTCGKLNIGLDFDGVIIDQTQNKIRVARDFGYEVKPEETPSEILKTLLPSEKYYEMQNTIYGKMTMEAQPVSGALEGIKKLSQEGHNLQIISCRRTQEIALVWLKQHGVLNIIPPEKVFFVLEEKEKNETAQKLQVDVFLDDKTKVLGMMPAVAHRVFCNPHRIAANEEFLEARSWEEFLKLLEKLKRAH